VGAVQNCVFNSVIKMNIFMTNNKTK